MPYNIFDKKSKDTTTHAETRIVSEDQQLLISQPQAPMTKAFQGRKVYLSQQDKIWVVDLADMRLVTKHNKEVIFLLSVFDICSKFARFAPLKDKKRNHDHQCFSKYFG